MRTRINKYTIIGERQIKLETPITIEDVRLIINETKKIVIASSMQKDNITIEGGVITYTDALPISEIGDYFTIEIDKGETIKDILGDANVLLSDVAEGKQQIADAINYKGGEAEPTQAFSTLAEEIKEIPNFDQWARLAGVLAGNSYNKNALQGHNENVEAGNIEEINDLLGVFTRLNYYCFYYWDLIKKVKLPFLTFIGVSAFGYSSVEYVELEGITSITNHDVFLNCSILKVLYAPNLTKITGSTVLQGCNALQDLTFGTLISFNVNTFNGAKKELRSISIGQDTDINLPFNHWTATTVIAEGQSSIDELNSNLYNNLLTKLYDHSTDGQTRTLHLGWLAHVTQENIDYANSKGWTLTT